MRLSSLPHALPAPLVAPHILPAPLVAAALSVMLACTPLPALAGVPGATGTYGGGLESKCSTVFAGTYTDPINHPGGTRKISLNPDFERPAVIFGQRLATVSGGGGRGEPSEYVLPATISTDDKKITIDFAPKGGPPDFPGVFETQADGTAGIRFVKDKNFWPRVEPCT